MKKVLNDILIFLRKPKDRTISKDIAGNKLIWFLYTLIISILLMIVSILMVSVLESLGLLDPQEHKITNLLSNPLMLILQAVIVAPIIEELIFRFQLTFKRNYSLKAIIYIISKFNKDDYSSTANRFKSLWDKYFAYVFYTVAVIFALIHSYNFTDINYFLLPLLVLPQFIIGLLIGYLRIRIGFIWGFLLHLFNNALAISVILIAISANGANEIIIENDSFDIIIEKEFAFSFPNDAGLSIHQDSIIIEKYRIDLIISSLYYINENRLEIDDPIIMNTYFSIKCYNNDNFPLKNNVVLDTILNALDIEIIESKRNTDIFKLIVQDTSLLNKYQVENNVSSQLNSNKEEFHFENARLSSIANFIGTAQDKIVEADSSTNEAYSFELPNTSIEEIDEYLNKRIGLDLQKSNQNSTFYKIKQK